MGKMRFFLPTLVVVLGLLNPNKTLSQTYPVDVPDEESVNAFKQYWKSFDNYSKKLLQEGKSKYESGLQNLSDSYNKSLIKITDKEFEHLKQAEKKYTAQLNDHPNATNKGYVLINLAQIKAMIGDHYATTNPDAGSSARLEAIGYIDVLQRSNPSFAELDKALYLKGLILRSMNRHPEAVKAFQEVLKLPGKSIHSVYAAISIGDFWFDKDESKYALRAYTTAESTLTGIDSDSKDADMIRIRYRKTWAAYRAGELGEVISTAPTLLLPAVAIASQDQLKKIQRDAVDLLGDALYENNTLSDTKRILNRRELELFAAAIGLRALQRYNSESIHNEAISLGTFLSLNFATALEAPQIFHVTADSLTKSGKDSEAIAYLEKLSMLLPERSLWRSRYRDRYQQIEQMTRIASAAAKIAADWHYDKGMKTGNKRSFHAAAEQYNLLIETAPNGEESNKWRLRQANSVYFTGMYADSSRMYRSLKTDFKVEAEVLQVASYQLVLSDERKWRKEFADATRNSKDPKADQMVSQAHDDLLKSANEFSAQYPGQSRSIDLLLVAADTARKMERWNKANEIWQRVLVANPGPAQRGLAIKGVIAGNKAVGSIADVVHSLRQFLSLEDWGTLDGELKRELLAELSTATIDEGKRLAENGRVKEAGVLMSRVAMDYNIPRRETIYKDGAFHLAISGEWAEAQQTAEQFLASNFSKHRPEMVYLLARANEYQFRMDEAAKHYLEVGLKYKKHSRARVSLERAEELSVTNDNYILAAAASTGLADLAKDSKTRLRHFKDTVSYLEKTDNYGEALKVARRRLTASRTVAEKLDSQLLVTKTLYKMGPSYEQEALDDLHILAKRLRQSRRTMGSAYGPVAGETFFLLGEESRRAFEDFKVAERSGNRRKNIGQKIEYFESMAKYYDESASTADPEWSARARYTLGIAAEKFADELASLQHEATAQEVASQKYQQTVDRLRDLAKRYFSTNVLAAQKSPADFNRNVWIDRSNVRLTGFRPNEDDIKMQEELPLSTDADLPSQWSL